jgi:uncharacterized OB-fold protein
MSKEIPKGMYISIILREKRKTYSKPFWEGTERRELLIQECVDCGKRIYPPAYLCPSCLSTNLAWMKASGKGKVYSFSTLYQGPPVHYEGKTPYTLALVDLKEGVRMLTHIVECKAEEIKCDMEVEVTFEDFKEMGLTLPKFRPI